MMYAVTPAPALSAYVNVLFSGSARWSMRSRPHDGVGACVASVVNVCVLLDELDRGVARELQRLLAGHLGREALDRVRVPVLDVGAVLLR